MSTPPNILDNYRSYAYHHVMFICDNVNTAQELSTFENISELLKENTQDDKSTIIKSLNNTGKYAIIHNGFADARYSITSLRWESITDKKGNNTGGNYTSIELEGNMTIIEPKGVRFLNDVQDIYRGLGVDQAGVIWGIKTFFVGFNNRDPISIDNIKPILFNITNVDADFSTDGGVYNISFMPNHNGVGHLPQYSKAAESIKLNAKNNPILRDVIKAFESRLNDITRVQFEKAQQSFVNSNLKPLQVKYIIELNDFYDSTYVVDDSQQQNKDTGDADEGVIMDFSKGITVENAIKTIMNHCSKVKSDVNDKPENRYGFKIRSILLSDKNTHTIKYSIIPYKMIFFDAFRDIKSKDSEVQKLIEENTVEFDYFFSGNNVDIIDFNLKMNMGLTFFQTIIASNNIGTQSDSTSGFVHASSQNCNNTGKSVNQIDEDNNNETCVPIFASTNIKNYDAVNFKNVKDSTEFQTLLNRHAAVENINAQMKIRGNPMLLNSINKLPDDFDITEVSTDVTFLPHWEKVPALCKINIFMPTDAENEITSRNKFWYDGLYYIFKVLNSFDSGGFTQDLHMTSIPNSIEEEDDATITKDKSKNITVLNDEGQKLYTVKPYVPKNDNKEKTFNEIVELAYEIGPQYNVEPNLILAVIQQESNFNPRAGSSAGALGLMQLIPTTAEEVGVSRDDLFIPRQNIIAGTKYLRRMLDLHDNDLTLALAAYNAGPGNVRKYGGVPPFDETQKYVKIVPKNLENFNNQNLTASNSTNQNEEVEVADAQIINSNTLSIDNILNNHNSKFTNV